MSRTIHRTPTATGRMERSPGGERPGSGPEADEQAIAPDAGEQAIGPEAGEQAIAPDAGEQAIGPEAGEQAIGPEAGEQAIAPEAGERAIGVAAVRALARTARVLERATGDLGLSHYRVLSAIADGEERASRVAQRFGLGRPAVSAAVEALSREGLIRRTGATADQRAVDLAVTPAGQASLDRVEGEMVEVLTDLCGRSGACSAIELLETLAALGPAVDDLLAERLERRRGGR